MFEFYMPSIDFEYDASGVDQKGSTAWKPVLSNDSGHKGQQLELLAVLGEVMALMIDSPVHHHLFVHDIEWLVIPPILHGQFRVYKEDGVPFAYASWAFLNVEAGSRMKSGQERLRPDEWNSGGQAWIVDLIAPYGRQEYVLKDLKENALKGFSVNMHQQIQSVSEITFVER